MENLIQPRILKGFRDFMPDAEIARASLIEKITAVYRSFGFVPIDTPVLEYSEILLRKSGGETEKQVFRFEDNGGRDVALRFDLTVPFARFAASHKDELYFPFKRYHIAKVWRGEKPQAGRYREFVQCDVDTVGADSAAADFEILSVMRAALAAAGAERVSIHVNHRGIFNRFLCALGLEESGEEVMRIVDKRGKVSQEELRKELSECCGTENAERVLSYVGVTGGFLDVVSTLEEYAGGPSDDTMRMRDIYAMMEAAGIAGTYVFDPGIARGLDYYTGIVYETFLDDLPSIGSVCSGGRYDNLAGLYMKERLPGVGTSIGIDRLIAGLETLGRMPCASCCIDAEIFCQDGTMAVQYQKSAAALRANGVAVEVFPEPKKMAQQYAMAEAKRVPWGIFVSAEDAERGMMTVKNLSDRSQAQGVSAAEAAAIIRAKRI